ncbi:winged helix DNA-binding domain-containing protein [Microlunatus aurantiacus]|uniref:Winged helix DNA-binding domain-containing protein n=1 Tax=Microlunatus aurantiacus TaxID=446786 RepID=A0ABP7DAY6_9ACTN
MQLTARQLNRTLLHRQLLTERAPLGVVETVRRLVGLQAQQPAGPYLALWNRIVDFDPAELDAAFASHRIVKATLLRITLHAVAAEDRAVFHAAVVATLRAARLNDARFLRTGLTSDDADGSVAALLAYLAEPRGNTELDAFFAERFPDLPETGIWWALRSYAPLIHGPGPHPWTYGHRPSYLAAPTQAQAQEPIGEGEAMVELARRYLAAYGPATPADLAQFATLRRPPAKQAFADLADELVTHTGPDGKPVSDLAVAELVTDDRPVPPRLLGMWDNVLLAHADRSRLIPAEHRATVIRRNGDVLPTLLVDGYVAGVWRPVEGGVEATAFRSLPDEVWEGLAAEARALRALVADREPLVFGRYAHWWRSIEGVQVRVL